VIVGSEGKIVAAEVTDDEIVTLENEYSGGKDAEHSGGLDRSTVVLLGSGDILSVGRLRVKVGSAVRPAAVRNLK
jgi:hypothetical protein